MQMSFKTLFTTILAVLSVIVSVPVYAWSDGQPTYNESLVFQAYVSTPRDAIIGGMDRYKWKITSEKNNQIVAELNYKGRKIILNISYTPETISFEEVSQQGINCNNTNPCNIDPEYYSRWRTNLRKGIALEIGKKAVEDSRAKLEKLNLLNH